MNDSYVLKFSLGDGFLNKGLQEMVDHNDLLLLPLFMSEKYEGVRSTTIRRMIDADFDAVNRVIIVQPELMRIGPVTLSKLCQLCTGKSVVIVTENVLTLGSLMKLVVPERGW